MHAYVLRKEMEWGPCYTFQILGENNSPHSTYLNIFIVNLGGGKMREREREKEGDTRDWNQEFRLTVGICYSDITQGKVTCWVCTAPKLGSTSLPSNQTFCLLPCSSCLCYTHTLEKVLWKKPSMNKSNTQVKTLGVLLGFTGHPWSKSNSQIKALGFLGGYYWQQIAVLTTACLHP